MRSHAYPHRAIYPHHRTMDYLKELYDIEHYDLAKSGLSEAQMKAV